MGLERIQIRARKGPKEPWTQVERAAAVRSKIWVALSLSL